MRKREDRRRRRRQFPQPEAKKLASTWSAPLPIYQGYSTFALFCNTCSVDPRKDTPNLHVITLQKHYTVNFVSARVIDGAGAQLSHEEFWKFDEKIDEEKDQTANVKMDQT